MQKRKTNVRKTHFKQIAKPSILNVFRHQLNVFLANQNVKMQKNKLEMIKITIDCIEAKWKRQKSGGDVNYLEFLFELIHFEDNILMIEAENKMESFIFGSHFYETILFAICCFNWKHK